MVRTNDVVYAQRGSKELTYDLYMPNQCSTDAAIIFVHGGGWISGDKSMYEEDSNWFAELGIPCACIEYRLAPLDMFPAQIQDLQDAIAAIREDLHRTLGFAATITVVGNSAGAHLSLMSSLCRSYFGEGEAPRGFRPDRVVSICGITDVRVPREKHPSICWSFLEQFLGSLDNEERNQQASPITYAENCDSPTLLLHGTQDDIVPHQQSVELERAINRPDLAKIVLLEGEMHSFSYAGWMNIRKQVQSFVLTNAAVRPGVAAVE